MRGPQQRVRTTGKQGDLVQGQWAALPTQELPVEDQAVAAGDGCVLGRLGVEQQAIDNAPCRNQGCALKVEPVWLPRSLQGKLEPVCRVRLSFGLWPFHQAP